MYVNKVERLLSLLEDNIDLLDDSKDCTMLGLVNRVREEKIITEAEAITLRAFVNEVNELFLLLGRWELTGKYAIISNRNKEFVRKLIPTYISILTLNRSAGIKEYKE